VPGSGRRAIKRSERTSVSIQQPEDDGCGAFSAAVSGIGGKGLTFDQLTGKTTAEASLAAPYSKPSRGRRARKKRNALQ